MDYFHHFLRTIPGVLVLRNDSNGEYIPEDRLWLHGNKTSEPGFTISSPHHTEAKVRNQDISKHGSFMRQERKARFNAE